MRFVLLALALAACTGEGSDPDSDSGPDGEIYPIASTLLSGVIGGEPWVFSGGETDSFLSDETEFFATMSDESGAACGFDSPETDFILSVPTEAGTYPFTATRNATFVVGGNENLVTFTGTVEVIRVFPDQIEGAVYAYYDDDNEIDGRFILTRCTE